MILYYLFYLSSRSLLVSMLWLRSATAVKWRKDEKLSISNMSSSQTFFKSFCKHFRQQFWFITNWYSAFYSLSNAIKTSTKGISSIKPEMGILIIYSYSVIDVRTWWFGWVQEIQEAIFKREHSSSALLLICNKHSWDTIAAKIKSYKA